jgi:hypothetical protein
MTRRLYIWRGCASVLLWGVLGANAPVQAQDTRDEELARKQAEKAKQVKAYEPGRGERAVELFETFVLTPPRFYPFFGSVYPGGLLAVGPGYRQAIGDTALLDVHGAWSIRNYKLADATLRLPELADRRVRFTLRANYIDAPSVSYYGRGNDSREEDRVTFAYQPTSAEAIVRIRPVRPLVMSGGVQRLETNIDRGSGSPAPIDDRFGPADLAGFGEDLTFTRTHASIGIDWRDAPGYSRRGGLYQVQWFDYRAADGRPYDFRRVDAEIVQFIPVMQANWVFVLRGLASVTETDDGQEVPFYLLPDLGGSGELPGYPSWRFRDRNRILVSGEYRWTPGQFVDMALFYQAGKVTARRADLDLDHLRDSYGVGIRFHAPTATVMRIELAKTKEGLGLVMAFSQGF